MVEILKPAAFIISFWLSCGYVGGLIIELVGPKGNVDARPSLKRYLKYGVISLIVGVCLVLFAAIEDNPEEL